MPTPLQTGTVRDQGTSINAQITLTGVTAGNFISVSASNFTSIGGVASSNGGALTKAVSYADGSPGADYNEVGIWYLANVAAGTHVLTITSSGSGPDSYISASASEWPGVVTSSPLDRTGTGANSLTATASAANTQNDILVLTAVVADGGASNNNFGTPSGYTLLDRENDSNNFTGYQAAYKTVSASETSSATHTATGLSSSQYDTVIATFKLAAGPTNYPLPVTAASYSVTASAETLAAGRALPVTAASYAVTTSAVNLAVGRKLDIAAASYALTAANITLTYTPVAVGLAVDPATYSLAAAAESFGVERKLAYDAATYTLSASAETLAVGRAVNFVTASYALTPSAETLTATRALSVDPASYSLTAAPVTLVYESLNKSIDIEPASYSLSMADVGMFRSGGGGVDSWGSVYARKKKKPEVTVAGPPPGPTVRESIEQTWAAAEARTLPKQPTRVRPVEFDEDEDEVLLLLH